jgi:excinuclease ABC subunit C
VGVRENEERRERLLKKANELPLCPGVYVMKSAGGKVIYVGKSRKLKNRVSQYFQNSAKNIKTERMASSVWDFDYYICNTEIEALSLENTLIKQYTPRYNIRLKDAKSYPYIKITKEDYPRILFTRKREGDKAGYFGPYTGTSTVFSIMNLLQKTLGIPSCNRRFPRDIGKERPCVYFQMHQCCGLCTGNVSPEEYGELIKCAADILRGNTAAARQKLEEQMMEYAEKEMYEAAANCRDTISALEKIKQRQHVVASPDMEEDVVGLYSDDLCSVATIMYVREGAVNAKSEFVFGVDSIADESGMVSFICDHYRMSEYIPKNIYVSFDLEEEDKLLLEEFLGNISGHRVYVRSPERGEQKNLCELAVANAREKAREYSAKYEGDSDTLVKLASLLQLEVVPERIESYDISNIGAEFKTAGMIVCENGEFVKADYRTFRIKSVDGTDDYASMREAIMRRIEHLADESGAYSKRPDLILLDGGRGHVSTIRELLHEMGRDDIPVYGMVKDDFHRTRALCDESEEYDISGDRGLFTYIYKIQEEVHRFTVSKMQGAKRKTVRRSILENIPGIGAEKAKSLLKHFGTVAKVKTATRDELCSVKGITLANAMAIEQYYSDKK